MGHNGVTDQGYRHPSQSRLSGSKRYIVLRPRAHRIDFFDQVSHMIAARHKINIRGVDGQQGTVVIAKEKFIVGPRYLSQILGGNIYIKTLVSLPYSFIQDVRAGLQIDDQVRLRDSGAQGLIELFVQCHFLAAQIQRSKDPVLGK